MSNSNDPKQPSKTRILRREMAERDREMRRLAQKNLHLQEQLRQLQDPRNNPDDHRYYQPPSFVDWIANGFERLLPRSPQVRFYLISGAIVFGCTVAGALLTQKREPTTSPPSVGVPGNPVVQPSSSALLPQPPGIPVTKDWATQGGDIAPGPVPIPEPLASIPQPELRPVPKGLTYKVTTAKVTTAPVWKKDPRLDRIVAGVRSRVAGEKRPKNAKAFDENNLSIVLIDVSTGARADLNGSQPRFPASVVKLFWLVNYFAQHDNGQRPELDRLMPTVKTMIRTSDNNAASIVVDTLTLTKSDEDYDAGPTLDDWIEKRSQLSKFFSAANYQNIRIAQKSFPITQPVRIPEPQKNDLKIRLQGGRTKANPIRNSISADQAARLMYEIATRQAISQPASGEMLQILTIDPATRATLAADQSRDVFNPIRDFFGKTLPPDAKLATKAGWTNDVRHEVAFIQPPGKPGYILAVFAEDKAIALDFDLFPKISAYVYQQMSQ